LIPLGKRRFRKTHTDTIPGVRCVEQTAKKKEKIFTRKTIKKGVINPAFKGLYRYARDEIRKILAKEGLTENNRHDLWLCLLEDAQHEIPYMALGKIDAKIMYFLSDWYFIAFQRKIISDAVRDLGLQDYFA
jgi:hypothetical protein